MTLIQRLKLVFLRKPWRYVVIYDVAEQEARERYAELSEGQNHWLPKLCLILKDLP